MKKHVLILGGYGGVGKVLPQNLLKHSHVDITITGRNLNRAESFAALLRNKSPDKKIHFSYADATNKESLSVALEHVDLLIVTATTPDQMDIIAEAAIETKTDMIDILVRADVVDKLKNYREQLIENNRIFITQAGFHPGLPAPFIRYAKKYFDDYHTANIVMVMNALFEKPESTYEIIHEIGEANARILKNGIWKKATYKDAMKVQFSEKFGTRQCYPLQMKEIYPLEKELGILNIGVYAAGFNPFVDNFVFPLTMFLQFIKKGMGIKTCGKLMHWGINKFYNHNPGVEFKLIANGIKDGVKQDYVLQASSSDAFEFTSLAVIACLKQYLDNSINKPGLYLMGPAVDNRMMIEDLKEMGVTFSETIN